jgi:hypothetical protein
MEQRCELESMLKKHHKTLTKVPGLTALASHKIETDDTPPIHLQPYQLPHAYQDTVKQEIRRLNAATRVDAYPMPRIDDLIDRVGQTRVNPNSFHQYSGPD